MGTLRAIELSYLLTNNFRELFEHVGTDILQHLLKASIAQVGLTPT